jgi:hypothetical protein
MDVNLVRFKVVGRCTTLHIYTDSDFNLDTCGVWDEVTFKGEGNDVNRSTCFV